VAEPRRLDGAVLTVDGRQLRTDLYPRLTLLRVEESVQLPDMFEIRFEDADFTLFDEGSFKVGGKVEVALRAEGDPVLVTAGEITAISMELGSSGHHELVLAGLDLTHRLAREPKRRSFQRMTDTDIATQIAREYSLDADVDGSGQVHEYVLQASESDYAFLRRRASRIGFDFWITDRTFHFKRKAKGDTSAPVLHWGENLQRFKVRFSSSERCDEVVVRGWDPLAKRPVVGRATEGDVGTGAPAADEMSRAARAAFGSVRRFAGQFPVADQAEAESLAQSLLLRASGDEVVLRGEAQGDPLIGAGVEVKIEGVGTRLSGPYRVTSVEHLYGSRLPYVTRFVCGGKEPASLADLLSPDGTYRQRTGWCGLVVGRVTNNNDPEKLGRVKVAFPTLSEQDESNWARVVSPGAGPKRGLQCIPEINDEVLVGFELDDTTRPVVLGGFWNREDQPPDPALVRGGKVEGRLLASRANHRLTLIDGPTSVAELRLGDAECKLHLEKSSSRLEGEQKLVLSSPQIEIHATDKLVVDAAQIEISAKSTLSMSGKPIKLN